MKIDNNTDYSALFSSLGNSNNQNGFSLSDYADIKNGSYAKVMKAYYGKGNGSTAAAANSKKLDETATKNMSAVQKTSSELKDSVSSLTSAAASGDTDKLYKAAQDFADKYNSLMTDAGRVDQNIQTMLID